MLRWCPHDVLIGSGVRHRRRVGGSNGYGYRLAGQIRIAHDELSDVGAGQIREKAGVGRVLLDKLAVLPVGVLSKAH